MKMLGLFLAALTAVSFASCGSAFNAPKGAAPEQGAAAERGLYTWYLFYGKNGRAKDWLKVDEFTSQTQQYLDPKYVGTDTVLETSIWSVGYAREARNWFEAAGIPTYDYSEAVNPFKNFTGNHFKFNMLDVTGMKAWG